MTQRNVNWLGWVTLVMVVVVGYFLFTIEIPETPVIPVYDIPTAQEVADLIVIPTVDIPETRLSLRQDLKRDAINICDDEFDFDDVEDLFNDDDDVVLVREYQDDRHYSNINVGVDNDDDRTINVDRVFKVDVEPDIGHDFRDKVYVECEVTSDDGDLEADLDYSL